MNKSLINIYAFLVTTLFAVAPFVMTFENTERAELLLANALPSTVRDIASLIRWLLFVIISLASVFLISNKKNEYKISLPVVLFSGFYFIQLLYALIDGYDIDRFFFLTIFSILVPPFISFVFYYRINILKKIIYLILIFLAISLVLNGHLILSGQRFLGFMNNPNAYGISALFWLLILLLANHHSLVNKKLFYILFIALILTVLLSGSRNALVGAVLILFFHYQKSLNKLIITGIIILIAILITTYFIDVSFISDRLLNISDSYEDSGRSEIWKRSYFAIKSNLWWGNGMNANQIIADTGNMHNSYIRFTLNMGLFFTLIVISFYLLIIYTCLRNNKKIPTLLSVFLVIYGLMNVGEDYFVGLGSSAYIYMLFVFGLINFYSSKHASS